jgi:hypothetical protein
VVRSWTIALSDKRSITIHAFEADVAPGNPLNGGRPFHILLTDGLSDEEIVPDVPRTELVWYVDKPDDVHVEWLRFLAMAHVVERKDLYQTTFPMAAPPSDLPALLEGSVLDWVTVLDAPLARDRAEFSVVGAPTGCLWVLPISAAERELVEKAGIAALCGRLQAHRHPTVLDPLRRSYA